MIQLPFAFLNETLPLESPWQVCLHFFLFSCLFTLSNSLLPFFQVWCSFSLSSLPFYASYPNVEDARICLRLDPPFIVVPIPILPIHIAAKPINGDNYLRAERTLSALVCSELARSTLVRARTTPRDFYVPRSVNVLWLIFFYNDRSCWTQVWMVCHTT